MLYTVAGLLSAFTEVIVPVLLVAAVGYALGRARIADARALTALSLSVLIPALAFYALATSTLPHAMLAQISGYITLQFILIGIVVGIAARVWRRTRAPCAGRA